MLTITINSFSFLYGSAPIDYSGNGGGFVFDCRALPNPGRYEKFKTLSGKDEAVREYLETEPEVISFLNSVFVLVSQSINKYSQRGFTNLMVSFGCTGGQHRSVFAAEQLAQYVKDNFEININLVH